MQVDISWFFTFLIIYVESLRFFFFEFYGINNKGLLDLYHDNFLTIY